MRQRQSNYLMMKLSGDVVVAALVLGFDMKWGGWRSLLPWNRRLAQDVEGCDS